MMTKKIIDTFKLYKKILTLELKSFFFSSSTQESIKNKLLVLAPRLPPYVSGGVYRPMSWAKYAKDNNCSIEFLTEHIPPPYSKAGMHLREQIPAECKLHFIDKLPLTPGWKFSFRVDGNFLSAISAVETGLRIYRHCKPSVIIATGPSFDFFIAGYYLSKILNVPLILDYRDEWTENPFSFVSLGNSDLFWERRCINQATKIIFTTESMRNHQINSFNIPPNKTEVIFNGWEIGEHNVDRPKTTPQVSDKNELRLMYCGMLTEATPPKDFLQDLEKYSITHLKQNIYLHIIGKRTEKIQTQLNEYKYSDSLILEDFLPRNVAHDKMAQSDALILFTSKELERYIPGKLFDYLASKKPIIIHGFYGESAKIVESLNAGYFIPKGDIKRFKEVTDILIENQNKELNNPDITKWLENHTRERMANKLFSLTKTIP